MSLLGLSNYMIRITHCDISLRKGVYFAILVFSIVMQYSYIGTLGVLSAQSGAVRSLSEICASRIKLSIAIFARFFAHRFSVSVAL